MIDREQLLNAVASGTSLKQLAIRHECTVGEVRKDLDEYVIELASPSHRAAVVATTVHRLELMEAYFTKLALTNGDATAGTLVSKLVRTKSALLDLDAPTKLDMSITVEAYRETSTERLRRVLDQVKNEPVAIEGRVESEPNDQAE